MPEKKSPKHALFISAEMAADPYKYGFIRYRKKPVIVHAKEMDKEFFVKTLEGVMHGNRGDFLLIGLNGEMYPVKREIFFKTYEVVPL